LIRLFAPFRLDTENQCLWRSSDNGSEQRVLLKPKAFEVLRYLIEHSGRLVTQDEILGAVWPDVFVQPGALKRHIFDIRSELGDDPKNPRFIETIPRRGYQFIAATHDSAPSTRSVDGLACSEIVGRSAGLAHLKSCLLKSLSGRRQIVFVTGEAGIGKSALVDEFQRQHAVSSLVRVARGQCLEGYSGKEAYYPVLEALGSLCRGPEGEQTVQILAEHAPTWLVQFPFLLKRQQRDTLQREISGATGERMLRELADALELITASSPLLLILEDLHWVDHSTVDLISAIARGRGPARLMVVATLRSGDAALSDSPLSGLKQDLLLRQLCQELPLAPLSEAEIAEYLLNQSTQGVPTGLVQLLYRYSEGNPLFLVAALQHLTRRGFLSRAAEGWKLNLPVEEIELEVPESLRTMIEAQLGRLDAEHRQVLEVASVAGTLFCSTLSARAGKIDPEVFELCCDRLSRQHQILRPVEPLTLPDGTTFHPYVFVHAFYREILYRGQSSGRRASLHLRFGEQLEQRAAQAPSEVVSALAHHFESGGDWPRAIKYLLLSNETAAWQRALELTERVAEPERDPDVVAEIHKRLTRAESC
jgi:predicted ATPase/DNA-binding winged helix-turn-helix (wHTH) protein